MKWGKMVCGWIRVWQGFKFGVVGKAMKDATHCCGGLHVVVLLVNMGNEWGVPA